MLPLKLTLEHPATFYHFLKKGRRIMKTATCLTMHNNTTEHPMGRIMLYVSRNNVRHHLRFFIVNSEVTPILGRDSCVGMKLIKILDSDSIHKVVELSELPEIVSQDPVLSLYADVFSGLVVITQSILTLQFHLSYTLLGNFLLLYVNK